MLCFNLSLTSNHFAALSSEQNRSRVNSLGVSMIAHLGSSAYTHCIAKLREATPGVSLVTHFNNAGCSLPCRQVTSEVRRFLDAEELLGGYEAADYYAQALDKPYTACSKLLSCKPEEIAVVQSATQAWQQVFFGFEFCKGDRVVTSKAEYGSNFIAYLQMQKRVGIRIDVVNETAQGDIDLEHLEELVGSGAQPKLIAINHIPTSSGRVYDAHGVGKIANAHGVPFLLDACQSAGQLPLNVEEIGCDFLTGTSRKYLRGPRGVGFLYICEESMSNFEPMTLDVRGARWTSASNYEMVPSARKFEQFEINFAAKAGFGVAVEMAGDLGLDWIWERVQFLGSLLRTQLSMIPGVNVHDHGRMLCGIVSFTVEGLTANEVKTTLTTMSINVSVSSIVSSRLDFEDRNLDSVIRASVHYFNNEKEIHLLVSAICDLSS